MLVYLYRSLYRRLSSQGQSAAEGCNPITIFIRTAKKYEDSKTKCKTSS